MDKVGPFNLTWLCSVSKEEKLRRRKEGDHVAYIHMCVCVCVCNMLVADLCH